jgi:hypothetical protein
MISRRPEFFGRASSRLDYVMTVTRRMPNFARYQLIADRFRLFRQNVSYGALHHSCSRPTL